MPETPAEPSPILPPPSQVAIANIPTPTGPLALTLNSGSSTVLLGANGAGKTRLGAFLETELGMKAHRIGAHRNLTLKTDLNIRAFDVSMQDLLVGAEERSFGSAHRPNLRWSGNPAVSMLSDFDRLVGALYAEHSDAAVAHLDTPADTPRPIPKLIRLAAIWRSVLPHRELVIRSGSINVAGEGGRYPAGELSDGERVIFYLLGHALLAPKGSVLIFDEPELHINRSIMQVLWDAIESERRDCPFIYLTHDLEFCAARRGAQRYAVRRFIPSPESWDIELIGSAAGIPEELVTKIVGSRQPMLFVEGDLGSLDNMVYRHVYRKFTVHGAGSCDQVIRTVTALNANSHLHRLGCAGLIDSDDRSAGAVEALAKRHIYVLPVAEIESLFLLPSPFMEIAKLLLNDASGAAAQLETLKGIVFDRAIQNVEATAIEATRRIVDSLLKGIELSKQSPTQLGESYVAAVGAIDPKRICSERQAAIERAVAEKNYEGTLALYSNKGLLAEMARVLGLRGVDPLEEYIGRALGADSGVPLLAALKGVLPVEDDLLRTLPGAPPAPAHVGLIAPGA